MARRKETGHGGGHGWFVTFADLMGLLVSFFVMLVAFSTQDAAKLQIVAGSMREAFGVQSETRYSGIIDVDGKPNRTKPRNVIDKPEDSSIKTENRDDLRKYGTTADEDHSFALATASLRQAMESLPELADL